MAPGPREKRRPHPGYGSWWSGDGAGRPHHAVLIVPRGTRLILDRDLAAIYELRFGASNGEFRKENEAAVEDLFDLFEFEDLPCGMAKDFAEIKTLLLSKGKPIGLYDLLIAGEFRRVPGRSVENWLKP